MIKHFYHICVLYLTDVGYYKDEFHVAYVEMYDLGKGLIAELIYALARKRVK